MILDGWGIATKKNLQFQANTPNYDDYLKKYPNAQLLTHGSHVWFTKWTNGK